MLGANEEIILDKHEYKERYKELIKELITLQQQAITNECGLVVLLEGFDGAGKGSRISDLVYFLDARATNVYVTPDVDFNKEKYFLSLDNNVEDYSPFLKQFWDNLGTRSHITFFNKGWYFTEAEKTLWLSQNKDEKYLRKHLNKKLDSISNFEKQLYDDGYMVIKIFLDISKKEMKKRLNKLSKNSFTSWRVSKNKLKSLKDYDQLNDLYSYMIKNSQYEFSKWNILNANDKFTTKFKIAEIIVDALKNNISRVQNKKHFFKITNLDFNELAILQSEMSPKNSIYIENDQYLDVDNIRHDLFLDRQTYKQELKRLQKELFNLENEMYKARIPMLIMFEGWDAAGKGGAIKRIAQGLDARSYKIVPSPAPTKYELAHPHLWRYWTNLPKSGHVGIFDRSWYGRVLVERVEQITDPSRWSQGYDEINQFEKDLVDWGAILVKFWVNISYEEQEKRFLARQENPNKTWKITDEDWRNRKKFSVYKSAINDMFRLTSTAYAPWNILESDDKLYARIKALNILVKELKTRLK